MNDHMDKLRDISVALDNRPVWDKLGDNDPSNSDPDTMYARYGKGKDSKPYKSFWMTTNSEYGRFQALGQKNNANPLPNQSDLAKTMELLGSRLPSGRDPGAITRSRAESVARDEILRTGQKADSISRYSTGIKFPDIRSRYLPLRGYQDEFKIGDYERRKLTTGFAKGYMRTSCPRLWDNMRTIAEDAGFRRPDSRPDTQILKVVHSGDEGSGDEAKYFGDDFLTGKYDDMPSYDTGIFDSTERLSPPASRQYSAKSGSARSRQQGYL
ncbi:hypothetical protein LSH36_394g01043 [Paralvinella palmiformis]|uniref:Uncharacterized protein n=1 Tax=Paralvinella palmiformis TaxID=53620 RepID=A0AAD9N0N5_9ANNE|nr:hypothetical protein LSH36_394g01043 [Paralvinella palmiformis]